MKQFKIKSIGELSLPAKELIKLLKERPVVCFYGEMGVGKTTFIKEVCHHLGVKDRVNSPSFAIINEYSDKNEQPIYHFDLYRLKDGEELINIGAEEYFYSGAVCLIEWPQKAEEMLPDHRVNVWMEENNEQTREIRLEVV